MCKGCMIQLWSRLGKIICMIYQFHLTSCKNICAPNISPFVLQVIKYLRYVKMG